ncbi:hypothetical protein C9374_010347 [Naegleria lovaniensis]|uniref:EGF-like domain-containing protein n=1 Tax=Naegleria lovaniensis TaxID=51637 RepID=A0AA88KEF8_NAELO|nr:uncharacterized protein C9374_010347 [Naegleria lovaniensis]KAG2374973.1 hypothetical protein C9374_010347 [Naegleria lovaniensis]
MKQVISGTFSLLLVLCLAIFIALFSATHVSTQGSGQYSVSSIAGFYHVDGLNNNFHTEGVSATYAPLTSEIYDMTFAQNGDMYVVDQNLNRVLKVDATSGAISTVAGINVAAFNGDGMKGSRTALTYPRGVAVLPNGDVLIADTSAHRVRRVFASNGTVATFAGSGEGGYNGDNMLATQIQLKWPQSLAVTLNGEVLIADSGNHRILKIMLNGMAVTVAGVNATAGYNGDLRLATQAFLNSPFGVAVSKSTGEIFIADTNNHRIRKVLSNGNIVTVAGNGFEGYNDDNIPATQANIAYPYDMDISSSGEIYIVDNGNNRIRKVLTNGNITTFAGRGIQGFSGAFTGDGVPVTSSTETDSPKAIAISPLTGDVYFAERYRIRKVVLSTNYIYTVAGSGNPQYYGDGLQAQSAVISIASSFVYPHPTSAHVDPKTGDVYIADSGAAVIRKIQKSTGIITTIAGSSQGYSTDETTQLGQPGDYILATSAKLGTNLPGMAVHPISGDLYFIDQSYIKKISSSSGIVNRVAGWQILSFSGDFGPALSATLNEPQSLAFAPNGDLYIADKMNRRIRKIFTNGTIVTFAGKDADASNEYAPYSGDGGPAANAVFLQPSGVAVTANGEVIIADTLNNRVRKVFTNGTVITIAGTGPSFYDGGRYNGDGMLATNATLNIPTGVAVTPNGEVIIADTYNHRIRKILLNGTIITIAGGGYLKGYHGNGIPARSALLMYPKGVSVDSNNGDIYVYGDYVYKVCRISAADGMIYTLVGNARYGYDYERINVNGYKDAGVSFFSGDGLKATMAQMYGPRGLFVNSVNEDVWIADSGNNRIRKVTATSGIMTTVAGGEGYMGSYPDNGSKATMVLLQNPIGIWMNRKNGEFVIADSGNSKIRKIDGNGNMFTIAGNGTAGYNGDGILATLALFNQSSSVFVSEATNDVYVADTGNHRIRKISASTGIVTTIAGTGVAGYNGDQILATSAMLNSPNSVYVTSNGEVYFADSWNHRIRKIFTNGTIITIAGNGVPGFSDGTNSQAIYAQLNTPLGIFVLEQTGEVYICDTYNHRIRVVNSFGTISTIAGHYYYGYNGDATSALETYFNYPTNIHVSNTTRRIYVSDYLNHLVRMLEPLCGSGQVYDPSSSKCVQDVYCYGVSAFTWSVCSGHGSCISENNCQCQNGYFGTTCQITQCNSKLSNDSSVCSSHGSCVALNSCSCISGWTGLNCEQCVGNNCGGGNNNESQIFTCNGTLSNSTSVCNGNGNCTNSETCQCMNGFSGKYCERSLNSDPTIAECLVNGLSCGALAGIVVGSVVGGLLVVGIVSAVIGILVYVVKKKGQVDLNGSIANSNNVELRNV